MLKIIIAAMFLQVNIGWAQNKPAGSEAPNAEKSTLSADGFSGEYSLNQIVDIITKHYKGKGTTEFIEESAGEFSSLKTKGKIQINTAAKRATVTVDKKVWDLKLIKESPPTFTINDKEIEMKGDESPDLAYRKIQVFMKKEFGPTSSGLFMLAIPSAHAFLDKEFGGLSIMSWLLIYLGFNLIYGATVGCKNVKEHAKSVNAMVSPQYPKGCAHSTNTVNGESTTAYRDSWMPTILGGLGTSLACGTEKSLVSDAPICGTSNAFPQEHCYDNAQGDRICRQPAYADQAAPSQLVRPAPTAARAADAPSPARSPANKAKAEKPRAAP